MAIFSRKKRTVIIPPIGASAYVLLTIMVCDEDTTANGPAMGRLTKVIYHSHPKNRKLLTYYIEETHQKKDLLNRSKSFLISV